MVEKLNPTYQLPRTKRPTNTTPELMRTVDSVNKALNDGFELEFKQPVPEKQIVSMTGSEAPVFLKVTPDLRIPSKWKTYIMTNYMAFLEFAHILWKHSSQKSA